MQLQNKKHYTITIVLFLASVICLNVVTSMIWSMEEMEEEFTPMFYWGVSERQGKRTKFEDTYVAYIEAGKRSFFGVFDGHGGTMAAEYARDNLWKLFDAQRKKTKNITESLKNAFLTVDNDLMQKKEKSGTTAVVAYKQYDDKKLYVAWAGDSRAMVIGKECEDCFATKDHKPNLERERVRIKAAIDELNSKNLKQKLVYEKVVTQKPGDPHRVFGLAVSRSLGDFNYKNKGPGIIIAKPDVETTAVNADDVLLLACDGFWDVMPNEGEVAQLVLKALQVTQGISSEKAIKKVLQAAGFDVKPIPGTEKSTEAGNQLHNKRLQLIARALVNAAYNKKSGDNISVLLAQFNE